MSIIVVYIYLNGLSLQVEWGFDPTFTKIHRLVNLLSVKTSGQALWSLFQRTSADQVLETPLKGSHEHAFK